MGLFSLFKAGEKLGVSRGMRRTPPVVTGEVEPRSRELEQPAEEVDVAEVDVAEVDEAADTGTSAGPLLDAIVHVEGSVEKNSSAIQSTLLHSASEQNSVIQGIYRLIDQRTMDRAGLNKRRREAWKVLSDSLGDVRLELSEIGDTIKNAGLSPEVLQRIESAIVDTKNETRGSRERIEEALGQLRDAQTVMIESMLSDLREAERERVDTVVRALREEAEKRVEAVKRADDVRVFDAVRSADERVTAQRDVQKSKLEEIEALYRKEFARLEASYREIAREKDDLRRRTLLEMVANLDVVEARLRDAEDSLERRNRAVVDSGSSAAGDGAGDGESGDDRKVSFFEKLFGQRRDEQREDVVTRRFTSIELSLFEIHRNNTIALRDLQRSLLDSLAKEGVEAISAVGERFRPGLHVKVEEVAGQPAGTIVREYRRGYLLDGHVLRPSQVVVAAS